MNTKIISSALLALTLCTPLGTWAAGENNSEESCLATFSVSDQTLTLPCVEVVMGNETVLYSAQLQQVEEGRFALTQVAELSAAVASECVASYSLETGELGVPCVEEVNSLGEMESYKVLLQATLSNLSQPIQFVFSHRNTGRFTIRRAVNGNTLLFQQPVTDVNTPIDCSLTGTCIGSNVNLHVGVDYMARPTSNVSNYPTYAVNFGMLKRYIRFDDEVGCNSLSCKMGNTIVLEHLLTTGEKWLSLYAHLNSMSVPNVVDRPIAKNQQIGIIGCSGETQYHYCGGVATGGNKHVHLEIKKTNLGTLDLWPYGYMSQDDAGANTINNIDEISAAIRTAINRQFSTVASLQGQNATILVPYFSTTNTIPNSGNYEVYGIANSPLYASLTMTAQPPTDLIVGGRDQWGNIQDISLPTANGWTKSGSRTDLAEADYRFYAYSDGVFKGGYPIKFTLLPNANSKIVDNDSRTGFTMLVNSNSESSGYYLSAFLYSVPGVLPGGIAKWEPSLTTQGNYEVWVHVPWSATATNVRYKIYPNGRDSATGLVLSAPINHSTYNNQWVQLTDATATSRTWNFNSAGYVGLSLDAEGGNNNLTPGQLIGIDAVKFIYVAGGNPTPPPQPPGDNANSYFWTGNGSIISYHGQKRGANTGDSEYSFGIDKDATGLHLGNPVGFFQWQVTKGSCDRLSISADSPNNGKRVDITVGPWYDRTQDKLFENVSLPFVIGENNTGFTFLDDDSEWFVVSVAFKDAITQSSTPVSRLNAKCTSESPSYQQSVAGKPVILSGGYKWNGNASIISRMFSHLSSQDFGGEWPYGVFKDATKVNPSPEKPVVFFQWMASDICTSLTIDSPDLSYSEKQVKVSYKPWDSSTYDTQSGTLPITLYNYSDAPWRVIQVAFDNPVSTPKAKVEAKCPGF